MMNGTPASVGPSRVGGYRCLIVAASAVMLMSTTALASSATLNCTHKVNSKSVIESKITATQKVVRTVTPYLDGMRKCFMEMEVQIDGNWIPTSGFKIFDADMSETQACNLASKRAKVSLLSKLGLETVVQNVDRQCVEKSVVKAATTNEMCMRVYKNVISAGRPVRVWSKLCNENGRWIRR